MILTKKQTKALDFLEDNKTVEVYYGGAAGGGKSRLGAYFQLKQRFKYPGTRGLIGRASIKTLKETTIQTFFEVAKEQGIIRGTHFDLTSAQDKEFPNCLVFANKSLIYLKDLYAYPADPDFDELGSLEITDAFIDEAPQVTAKAKNIVRSRMRFKLDEFGLMPKMLMSGNPSKGWAYSEFYKPWKDGTISKGKQFIQALPGDNPHLPASYIESLRGLDKISRERLLEGNWEYDDDPAALCDYNKIVDLFSNDFDSLKGDKYISADVARLGSDKIVVGLWDGWRVKIKVYEKKRITESYEYIKNIKNSNDVPKSNIVADEDGVGGGLVDMLKCRGFVNGSSPLPHPTNPQKDKNGNIIPENYANLKSQCYFRLAERINKGGLYIECDDPDMMEAIIEELEQVKQYNMDKDGKKAVLPKDKVKALIGRSPDYADMLMMRELFELRNKKTWAIV